MDRLELGLKRAATPEAALKYLVLGGAATATFLMGVSLLYGQSGTLALAVFAQAMARGEPLACVVGDVMDTNLLTATEDDDVDAVLAKLRRRAVRRVPIVGKDGGLVGILTLDDIIEWISEELREAATVIERQGKEFVP